MKSVYFCLMIFFLVALSYWAGRRIETERCKAAQAENVNVKQGQIIKLQEQINAETVSRRSDDIRRILREKYSIAQ